MRIMKKTITNKLIKTEVYNFGFFIVLCLSCLNCTTKSISAEEIIDKSVEAHGGFQYWSELKQLEFDKSTILYTPEGDVEREINQHQMFLLKPSLEGAILSNETYKNDLYFHGNEFSKVINDSVFMVSDSLEFEAAKNTFFAAHYVVCQPFKLKDENLILKYVGKEKIDNTEVYAVNVSYTTDDKQSDKWTYYFDAKTYKLVANKVTHNGNISLIKNVEFDLKTKLVFNAHRKSYTILGDGSAFLRAEYFYTNFKALFE